jgi:hypothetical protein
MKIYLPTNRHDSRVGRLFGGMDHVMQYPNFVGKNIKSNNPLSRRSRHCIRRERGGDDMIISWTQCLTLSCLGALLVHFFALLEHISLDNGLIGMIQLDKVFVDVLAMRFACSIMKIRTLVAKLWC